MPTLHIVVEDASAPVRLLKAIRGARRILGDEAGATLQNAQKALERAADDVLYIGEHADEKLVQDAADEIEYIIGDAGIPVIDLGLPGAQNLVEIDPSLLETTEDGYKLAIQLLTMTNGEPLKALIGAVNLGRMMPDKKYIEAIVSLITVFPALAEIAENHGLLERDST